MGIDPKYIAIRTPSSSVCGPLNRPTVMPELHMSIKPDILNREISR